MAFSKQRMAEAHARAAEIRRRHRTEHATIGQLARETGLHKATISRILRGELCPDAPGPVQDRVRARGEQRLSEQDRQALRRAFEEDESIAQLAETYRLSQAAVRRVLGAEPTPQIPLSDAQVLAMRREYAAGKGSQRELAKRFGVPRTTFGSIVRGDCYEHLPGAVRAPDPRTKWKSDAEVLAIRRAFTEGVTYADLAQRFDLSRGSVAHIVRGRTYRHVGGPTGPRARKVHRRARALRKK